MSDLFSSQAGTLAYGITLFEQYINRAHKAYEDEEFFDWPTIFLTTTLQATSVSLIKLLPSADDTNEILDKRSIASLVRNIIDTHDVLDMMSNADTPERLSLHRNILGMYISGRISKIQKSIDNERAEKFYPYSKEQYWKKIKSSPCYSHRLDKLKNGEGVFYNTRMERLKNSCEEHADFVSGIIADLSTLVHSIPPTLWLSGLNEIYNNSEGNRNMVSIWLRVANFFFARSISCFLKVTKYDVTPELQKYITHHRKVFS
ncbi:hypothetical protein J4G57_07875 [Aeromonas caviae]|uniref:hypothetical protein n=1 Tax=Aeromonas caviae TaxID=648 RepID=UPI001BD376E1|nr:hypothetical protein [Aeromonas caviae]MBS4707812.1 hypothetical protein [Aeromonas caviae]